MVVVCHIFQHANRTSGKDKPDTHRISDMMHENGGRQNEEKKYVRVIFAASCHDKDHTSMLGMVMNVKLLIRKTYQHSWGTEHVTEWVIYQVEEGSCI